MSDDESSFHTAYRATHLAFARVLALPFEAPIFLCAHLGDDEVNDALLG